MSNDTHLLTEDTIESADTIRMPRPLYKVYRVFISKRTGIGLILAMGFLTLMGTLIQQSTETERLHNLSEPCEDEGLQPERTIRVRLQRRSEVGDSQREVAGRSGHLPLEGQQPGADA